MVLSMRYEAEGNRLCVNDAGTAAICAPRREADADDAASDTEGKPPRRAHAA